MLQTSAEGLSGAGPQDFIYGVQRRRSTAFSYQMFLLPLPEFEFLSWSKLKCSLLAFGSMSPDARCSHHLAQPRLTSLVWQRLSQSYQRCWVLFKGSGPARKKNSFVGKQEVKYIWKENIQLMLNNIIHCSIHIIYVSSFNPDNDEVSTIIIPTWRSNWGTKRLSVFLKALQLVHSMAVIWTWEVRS